MSSVDPNPPAEPADPTTDPVDPGPTTIPGPNPDPSPVPIPGPDPAPVDPPAPPVPQPTPSPKPHRFVDLLDAEGKAQATLDDDDRAIGAATDALAAANDQLKAAVDKKSSDTDTLKAADGDIAGALAASGPRFLGPLADGTVKVFTADGSGGYHVTLVRPSDEPL